MARSVADLDITTVEAGGCFAQWKAGVPCPNRWAGVIETINKDRPGYGQFCEIHMDGYRALNPGGENRTWKAHTRAEWEASGRGPEIDRQLGVARGSTEGTVEDSPQ